MRNDKTCKYCEGDGLIVYSSTDIRPCAICEGAGVVSVPSHRPTRESVEDQYAEHLDMLDWLNSSEIYNAKRSGHRWHIDAFTREGVLVTYKGTLEGAARAAMDAGRDIEDQQAYAAEAIRLEASLLEGKTLREATESAKLDEPAIKKGGAE